MEIRSRKQDQGKRFDKQSSTIRRIAVDRNITFEACIYFTVEVYGPWVAYNKGIKREKQEGKKKVADSI